MSLRVQVAQAERRVSEARLSTALQASETRLRQHEHAAAVAQREAASLLGLKEEERRRLQVRVTAWGERERVERGRR